MDYRDASGARQRLTAPTKEAAENLLSEKTPDPDITLSEYKDRWLEMIESEVKPRTLASYTQLLDLHIVPAFGRVRLREDGSPERCSVRVHAESSPASVNELVRNRTPRL